MLAHPSPDSDSLMPAGKKRKRVGPMEAYSIAEFCDAHGIGVATYYWLRRRHEAPREMRIGRRRFISKEAAAEWRRAREETVSS